MKGAFTYLRYPGYFRILLPRGVIADQPWLTSLQRSVSADGNSKLNSTGRV